MLEKNMIKDIEKFGPEWIILEQITFGNDKEIVETIMKQYKLNWGELMEQAMSHKIFPMVAYYFIKNELFQYIPPFLNQYFRVIYDVNKEKVRRIKEKVTKIVQLLDKEKIEYVATKGVVLDNELYDNEGYRFMSDADFIVKQSDKSKVMSLLKANGFQVGTVDWKTNNIKPMEREEYITYLSTPDKLPEFVCEIDDNIIKYVSIGFVTSLTWAKCPFQVNIEESFKNIVRQPLGLNEINIPALNTEYHYIYIILHLYKHAWVEYLSRWNNDVNLAKFGDVVRFWMKHEKILIEKLPQIIKDNNIEKPIIWTLKHTDNVFNTNIVEKLGYTDFIDEDYLNSSGDKKGNTIKWKGTMRERLISKDRKSLFEQR